MLPNIFERDNSTDDKCTMKEKILRWALIASAVFAVIEMVLLLGLTVYWRAVRADLMKPHQLHISMSAEKLLTKKDDGTRNHCPPALKERIEKQTNSTRCYGTFSHVMDGLLAKNVIERYDSDTNPELASIDLTAYGCERSEKRHPTVRLVDIATDKTAVRVGLRSKIFWSSLPPSYTRSGLTYRQDDGTISVERHGLYYVSLQVKTKLVTTSTGNDTDNIIRHSVHQISNGTEAVILEDVRTMCETSTGAAESTSVLGAIFKLEYGDRLYAATSHPQNIAPDPRNNYFSIYSI